MGINNGEVHDFIIVTPLKLRLADKQVNRSMESNGE